MFLCAYLTAVPKLTKFVSMLTNSLQTFSSKFISEWVTFRPGQIKRPKHLKNSCFLLLCFTTSKRHDPYWTSRKNSLEPIDLSCINNVSLV